MRTVLASRSQKFILSIPFNGASGVEKELKRLPSMKANLWQQAILDEITRLLIPFNELSTVPPSVQEIIESYDRRLKWDGLKLKVTHYDDGVGRGWIIQFDSL